MPFIDFLTTHSQLIQTIALLITAIVALWAIFSSKQTTKKNNAANVLFSSRNDKNIRTGLSVIQQLHLDKEIDIKKYAYLGNPAANNNDVVSKKELDEKRFINSVLNHYEYIAVGIKCGIYDENIFKESSYNTMTSTYTRCEPYITKVRGLYGRNTTWCEFEKLAKRWNDKPIKNHSPK